MAAPDYTLVDTPEGYRRAAALLEGGRGPLAIDTERASAYRYDDRAFLVQVYRRGSGTFLFAPEGHRDELSAALAPVVNGEDWIVHAAPEDLPSLAELGLFPGTLFDTALAGRIAGYERSNLAAMVEEFCDTVLEKGHGREDWSQVPLPKAWLRYAAEDVIYLCDLAEAQAELLGGQGKLTAAEQEFDHIIAAHAAWEPTERTWRGLKGASALPNGAALAIARDVWNSRDYEAMRDDVSPSTILPNRVIIAMAKEQPRTPRELGAIKGFPRRRHGAMRYWFAVLENTYASDPASWPEREPAVCGVPSKSAWQRHHPESWEMLQVMRSAVAETASELDLPSDVLLTPAILREAVWAISADNPENNPLTSQGKSAAASSASYPIAHRFASLDTHDMAHLLSALGARPWQVEQVAPLFRVLSLRPSRG